MKRTLRWLAVVSGALLAAYVVLLGATFVVMRQPPDRFGQIMARVPGPMFMLIPFEPLWTVARRGTLNLGDMAPDFSLRTSEKTSRVQLSSFRGTQPVVLVFGSYT